MNTEIGDDLNALKFKSNGIAKIIENALNNKANRTAFNEITHLRCKGLSFQKIADSLNEKKLKTRLGKPFFKSSVKTLYDRFSKYYDFEKDQFKSGLITINSNKNNANVVNFGYLTIDDNNKVKISTRFKPFKNFTFISRDNNNFKAEVLEHFRAAFFKAKKKIIVSYFLHTNHSDAESPIDKEYFELLEDYTNLKELKYDRILQIPATIWTSIAKSDNTILPDLPLESIIIAGELLPESVKKHIYRTITESKEKFKLFILRKQRTYNTFAAIDEEILFKEEYVTNEKGITKPSDLLIYKSSNKDDDFNRFFQHQKNSLYKLFYNKHTHGNIKESANNIYDEPIPHNLFSKITSLVDIWKSKECESIFIEKAKELNIIKDLKGTISTEKKLLIKIKKVLKGIEDYRKVENKIQKSIPDFRQFYRDSENIETENNYSIIK